MASGLFAVVLCARGRLGCEQESMPCWHSAQQAVLAVRLRPGALWCLEKKQGRADVLKNVRRLPAWCQASQVKPIVQLLLMGMQVPLSHGFHLCMCS